METKYYELRDSQGNVSGYVTVVGEKPEMVEQVGKESSLVELTHREFFSRKFSTIKSLGLDEAFLEEK